MTDFKKEFIKTKNILAHKHNIWRVFQDFTEMAALSLSQAVHFDDEKEKQYLDVAKRYNKDEIQVLPKLLSHVVLGLEEKPHDFRGECFMQLDLGNHWKGQFFTPYHICQMMAQMRMPTDIEAKVKNQGYIMINEPCCGAGAMLIAFYEACRQKNIDTQHGVFAVAMYLSNLNGSQTLFNSEFTALPFSH